MDRGVRKKSMPRTGAIRKLLILVLILAMTMASLASCGKVKDEGNASKAGTIVAETDNSVTVIDQAGREVTVSKNPESVALCYRVVIRFLLSLDMGDKITGIGKTEDFLEDVQPSLKDCADVGKGVADIEALAELGPDLFIHKASDVETLDAVDKIGIPAVGIDVETPEKMITALKVLGIVCGKDDRAEELISYYESEIEDINELTTEIKEKKSAIVMGSSIGKVADGTMLQGKMLTLAGAVNSADGLAATELWPTAGTEQIFTWNPDYIFITRGDAINYGVKDITEDKTWSEVNAVKNKNVYLMPAEMDSWEFPGVTSLLGVYYMIHTMYPDLLSDEELRDKVNELYETMYGETYERTYLGY